MRGTAAGVFPICLLAALGGMLPGCTPMSVSPDTDYRRAFEEALIVGQCEGQAVDGMWAAHHRWYAVASAIAGYRKTDEAVALLRQGNMFLTIGCPTVARASYTALLRRFPETDYAVLRESAWIALQRLPTLSAEHSPAPLPITPPASIRTGM